ncbi:MAG TPA: lytic transglycosylase domain-containing protein [Verrucomicrobiae bacterium]|nr:lytic transglycosylase domain-containing protein [Verrucomicrobiae bacterium]
MKSGPTRALLLASMLVSAVSRTSQAQDDTITFDDLVSSAQQWAKGNLDEDVLRTLQQADREKVRKILADLQKEFQGQYVLDLAGLRDAAHTAIPLLEQYEETLPYALWLKVHLDDLEVANQLELIIPAPKPEPGKPSVPVKPTARQEREVWVTQFADRPYPEAARPFVPRLKSIFVSERVPPELIWIAEVESSFDPRVRSPAGAAGLFQLMPATARRYGLRTTWPWDQRLNPEPSARAAAHYLNYLHRHFREWRLALAAYNCGEGTVDELLKHSRTRSYEAIASRLPAETQMYVPKVEAILLRREGMTLAELHAPAAPVNR